MKQQGDETYRSIAMLGSFGLSMYQGHETDFMPYLQTQPVS